MKTISGYFISVFLLIKVVSTSAQDTLNIPLSIRMGVDLANPVMSLLNKDVTGFEAFTAIDLSEKVAAVLEAGHLDFKYSQYNYNYFAKGTFFRLGIDINSMKPKSAIGKYYAGIGVRYGLTFFSQEVKNLEHVNYWNTVTTDIPLHNYSAHFIEVNPGIRSEVFKNFSMGWTIRLRMLLYTNTGNDLRPVYLPGFGNAGKTFSKGFNYYLIWNIPYKNKTVITRPPVIDEPVQ